MIGIQQIEATGSYNVAQLTQLTPSVQFFSSNPRNTAITIRGLGTRFGLTNDGQAETLIGAIEQLCVPKSF